MLIAIGKTPPGLLVLLQLLIATSWKKREVILFLSCGEENQQKAKQNPLFPSFFSFGNNFSTLSYIFFIFPATTFISEIMRCPCTNLFSHLNSFPCQSSVSEMILSCLLQAFAGFLELISKHQLHNANANWHPKNIHSQAKVLRAKHGFSLSKSSKYHLLLQSDILFIERKADPECQK